MLHSIFRSRPVPWLRGAATALLACAALQAQGLSLNVTGADGKPLGLVMVTRAPLERAVVDTSDNGYAASGKAQLGLFESTGFTDARGHVDLPDAAGEFRLRLRKPGFKDLALTSRELGRSVSLSLQVETDVRALAEQRPSNAWTATLSTGIADTEVRKQFLLHCGFCHQQGSAFLRRERSVQEWNEAFGRMVRYGSRLSSQAQKELPAMLEAHWKAVNANPALVPPSTPWTAPLAGAVIRELPLGDAFSQMHDFVAHSNGLVYVGDNLQDRLYEVNPQTGAYTVYKVPPQPGDSLGGLLAGRLRDFPKHETYQGIHSLAESKKDGHLFITPSYQRRLIEFDPVTKGFSKHQMDSGFYPHTVRIDGQDRVWFTLALSNQVAMFDRTTSKFSTYDLPFRSFMERLTVKLTPFFFKLISWGLPVTNWVKIDSVSTGVPLPYGIDITPDGRVWVARLHTDEIACIDPASGAVTMIATPLHGPRRLRADRDGNLWIVMYNESALLRYAPATKKFTTFALPVLPVGSETPYGLNVDLKRHQVWVTGTNSDSAQRLDIASGEWTFFPLPRKSTFTRDVEITADGRVFLSSASFPSWHIEDAQPTLIELQPGKP